MRKRFVAITLLALPIGIAISLPVARVSSMHLGGSTEKREVVTKLSRGYDAAQFVIVGTLLVALAGVVRRSTEPAAATGAGPDAHRAAARPRRRVARPAAHDVAV